MSQVDILALLHGTRGILLLAITAGYVIFTLLEAGIGIAFAISARDFWVILFLLAMLAAQWMAWSLIICHSAISLASAWGIYRRAPWGRAMGLCAAAVSCKTMPTGPFMAAYTFIALTDKEVAEEFGWRDA